jgi:excisionase family DNA binding protein
MSAWLPPGLALGWLAILGTFVRGVGNLLAAWAATVSLVLLLARRRPAGSSDGPSKALSGSAGTSGAALAPLTEPASPTARGTAPGSSGTEEERARGSSRPASAAETASTPALMGSDPVSEPSSRKMPSSSQGAARPETKSATHDAAERTEQPDTAEIALTLGWQVLTAGEAASVLRVAPGAIIAAISNGELPGNRIGDDWRVDKGALTRWLQGRYGDLTSPGRSQSAKGSEGDPG